MREREQRLGGSAGASLPPAGCACHLPHQREARGRMDGSEGDGGLTCAAWYRRGQEGAKRFLTSARNDRKVKRLASEGAGLEAKDGAAKRATAPKWSAGQNGNATGGRRSETITL